MLSRNLKRALLDSRLPLPPTFLLPWAASLTTVSHATEPNLPPPSVNQKSKAGNALSPEAGQPAPSTPLPFATSDAGLPPLPAPNSPTSSTATPLDLSPSLRDLLPLLRAQSPHYITTHIHGRPYLLTQGDTVRLPFLMHGVEPGDTLRLNRAINIGSRDYTLKAAAARPQLKSPVTDSRNIIDPTTGQWASHSQAMPTPSHTEAEGVTPSNAVVQYAPHFIPHIEKGKHAYVDERLFVCRAVVMGVESEPLRIKEKTKRRQRKVKKVKSKHRFTILRIKEVRIRGEQELGELAMGERKIEEL